eukprot:5981604-Pleurochrysis_carterae.AAC.1
MPPPAKHASKATAATRWQLEENLHQLIVFKRTRHLIVFKRTKASDCVQKDKNNKLELYTMQHYKQHFLNCVNQRIRFHGVRDKGQSSLDSVMRRGSLRSEQKFFEHWRTDIAPYTRNVIIPVYVKLLNSEGRIPLAKMPTMLRGKCARASGYTCNKRRRKRQPDGEVGRPSPLWKRPPQRMQARGSLAWMAKRCALLTWMNAVCHDCGHSIGGVAVEAEPASAADAENLLPMKDATQTGNIVGACEVEESLDPASFHSMPPSFDGGPFFLMWKVLGVLGKNHAAHSPGFVQPKMSKTRTAQRTAKREGVSIDEGVEIHKENAANMTKACRSVRQAQRLARKPPTVSG